MSSPAVLERASEFEATQIGVESLSTPGTRVPALVRLPCTSIDLKPNIPVQAYRPFGADVSTSAVVKKEWSEAPLTGVLCFHDILYQAASVLAIPTISTPGGATLTRRWRFFCKTFKPNKFRTFSVEKGSDAGAGGAGHVMLNSWSFSLDENAAQVSGQVIGQKFDEDDFQLSTNEEATVDITGATAGTFTLNPFGLGNTAAIARNAALSAVQAAVDLVAGAGNTLVHGSTDPLPGSFKIQARGDLSQQNLTNCTANFGGLTGGTNTITTTTPGVSPVLLPDVTVSPRYPDVYIGDDVGSLAQLDRCDMFAFGCADRHKMKMTLDSRDESFSYTVPKAPSFTCDLDLMLNAYGRGLLADVRAAKKKFVRLLITGPEIESGFPYRIQLTMPFRFLSPDRGDKDDVYNGKFAFEPTHDESFGGWCELLVDTSLTAL